MCWVMTSTKLAVVQWLSRVGGSPRTATRSTPPFLGMLCAQAEVEAAGEGDGPREEEDQAGGPPPRPADTGERSERLRAVRVSRAWRHLVKGAGRTLGRSGPRRRLRVDIQCGGSHRSE